MAGVGDSAGNEIVARDLGFVCRVEDANAGEEEEAVEVAELVGECDAARVLGTWGGDVRDLTVDEAIEIEDWVQGTCDAIIVLGVLFGDMGLVSRTGRLARGCRR